MRLRYADQAGTELRLRLEATVAGRAVRAAEAEDLTAVVFKLASVPDAALAVLPVLSVTAAAGATFVGAEEWLGSTVAGSLSADER